MTASERTPRNELAWLANCYVAGELSVDETAAFEARLETDVAACSAVARAMELNLAIATAFESQPAAISSARWTETTIAALAASAVAAASVALMIGYDGSATNGVAHKDGANHLVAAWTSGEAVRNDDDDDDLLDGTDDADLDPPDWMFAALTVEKEQLRHDEVREN